MDIAGKTAVVTGGAAGIGRAIALRLARDGARVVIADVDRAAGEEAERALSAGGGHVRFIQTDLAQKADIEALVRSVESTYGGIDILVNNAGFAVDPSFPEAEFDSWRRLIDVNLVGLMLATQLAIPSMRTRGGGAIVNISSVAGLGLGHHSAPDYAASKAGVVRLTASLANLAAEDIRVNCVCPDWVDTPAVQRSLAAMTPEERERTAPAKLVPPERIADVVVEFIRDDSLAGRVMTSPCEGEWKLLPAD